MDPRTKTEVPSIHTSTDCLQRKLNHSTHNGSANVNQSQKTSPYDEVLLGINDPKFLIPIRKWEKRMGFMTPIIWKNVIILTFLHTTTIVWCLYNSLNGHLPKWQTLLFVYIVANISGFGVTGGVHRYWCHRSYKAKWPLQVILMLCYSVAGQNTIYEWVRDHRVHHKYSDQIADPHDASRGFFFSHVGWLMMKKHPEVLRRGAQIDMSDISNDPIVKFHTRYFKIFIIAFAWWLPSMVPLLWNESVDIAVLSQVLFRYTFCLNCTWSINSVAHLWGNKPYDRYIMPSNNRFASILSVGEGWHNYHHTFPWDYKASELGATSNHTTILLNLFARIGWAYDLKEASPDLVIAVAKRKGEPRA